MPDLDDMISHRSAGVRRSTFDFAPGSYGAYWWNATRILYVIGAVLGLLQYGHRGLEGILAALIVPAILAPLKALVWAAIFWVLSRLFR